MFPLNPSDSESTLPALTVDVSPSQYPEWLQANKPSLSAEDYRRYEQQSKVMGDICKLFEAEEQGVENKERTFESIMDRMQQVMQLFSFGTIFTIDLFI